MLQLRVGQQMLAQGMHTASESSDHCFRGRHAAMAASAKETSQEG